MTTANGFYTIPFWKDLVERAGTSAAQQFLAVTIASGAIISVSGLPWKLALLTAAGAALLSILMTLAQYSVGAQHLPFYADLAVRGVKSFAASLLALLAADSVNGVLNVASVSWTNALNIAALAAFASVSKSFLARGVGNPNNASLALGKYNPKSAY